MRTLGKYELVRRLSSAGMAEVYLGRQVGPVGFEKTVAIKRLHPSLAQRPELVRMFLSEARVAARLSHPNIGQIYELGHDDDEYFIAMEYVHGRRLAKVQEETRRIGERIPFGLAAHIVACVCRALHHAHTLRDELGNLFGLLHGDVNPESVILAFNGDVKLTDFGVAKATSLAAETQTGILKGKFGYMSPEQCRNEEADPRSDIFAAGIMLFELTCGQSLFVRDTDFATVRAVIKGVIPPPSAVVDDVPDELEEIIMTALARERDLRYQSAQEMQLALEAAIRANGWRTGPLALSRYVSEMFADRMTPSQGVARVPLSGSAAPAHRSREQRRGDGPASEEPRQRRGPEREQRAKGAAQSASEPSRERRTTVSVHGGAPEANMVDLGEPSASAPTSLETSGASLQADVETVDVPRELRPELLSGDFAVRGDTPFPAARARLGQSVGATPSARDAPLTLPDEGFEGPTIIQPPTFDDLQAANPLEPYVAARRGPAGKTALEQPSLEPPPGYWETPEPSDPSPILPLESLHLESSAHSPAPALHPRPDRTGRWLLWLTLALLVSLVAVGVAIGFLVSRRPSPRADTLVSVVSKPPGATVYIDGKEYASRTPTVLRDVLAGRRHWLVVTRDGYRTATRRFVVRKGERLLLDIVLEPGRATDTATLRVEVDPPGADVYLDGTRRGLAPIDLSDVAAGTSHTLVVRKAGYEDKTIRIERLKPAGRHLTSVKLSKASTKAPAAGPAEGGPVEIPRGTTGRELIESRGRGERR